LFGPHLIVDGSKCDKVKLADRHLIERLLSEYPRAIGMTRIGGPYMFEYQSPDPAYSGISGLVLIAESHIAIHTFPVLDYFSMDIFSCKNFDHEKALAYIRDALDVREMDRTLLQRGLSFRGPHHGPQGATDELIAAAAARNQGLAITIGALPSDDPLAPKSAAAGRMIWPTYGFTPDYGTYGEQGQAHGAYGGTGAAPNDGHTGNGAGDGRAGMPVGVVPRNAAALGARAPAGLVPVRPVQLNPTASVSGVLDRMTTLGGQGRRLGEALARWEALARTPGAPVVLALGPQVVACGLGDLVADLIQRGHVSAVIAEGATILADGYESLGYRHYIRRDDFDCASGVEAVAADDVAPAPAAEEWAAARTSLRALLDIADDTPPSHVVTARLGEALSTVAPRPGILSSAARRAVPVFATGDALLTQLGVVALDRRADIAALQTLLARPEAAVVAFGTTEYTSQCIAAAGAPATVIAVAARGFATPTVASAADVTLALPLLATGLAQRLPERRQVGAAPREPAVSH
jgi:S-adenosylmethionine decarboxylase